MKSKLLSILFCLFIATLVAQTETINITWHFGSNPVDATDGQPNFPNRTIEVGDTVIWNWTANTTHTVTRLGGTSSDTFDSGGISGIGATFSKTFSSVGTNDYQCNPHPANMYGTITVVPDGTLSVDENRLSQFKVSPNPVLTSFEIKLPETVEKANVEIYNVLGKQIFNSEISKINSIIDVNEFSNGVYLVKVSNGRFFSTKRIVKQ